ncbi:hypothetical protein DVH24_003716 [Malus domestica]|uniref:Uncharacterized protein n=1 Tax=Malus domestica TaxID=3750 RepID=A0A498IHZ5_MALDO|nr:hypothetical protein DVH24_003716 [Malus domestica]
MREMENFGVLNDNDIICNFNGALFGLRPGGILIDMTTSEPSLAVEISSLAVDSIFAHKSRHLTPKLTRSTMPFRTFCSFYSISLQNRSESVLLNCCLDSPAKNPPISQPVRPNPVVEIP